MRLGVLGRILAVSPLFETEPMYEADQPLFLNGASLIETGLAPRPLIAELKRIEAEVGRRPREVNGPREIDLDLIAWGAASYRFSPTDEASPTIEVPHPRAAERRFVLAPLAVIAPDLLLPGYGRVQDLLARTQADADSVHPYDDAALPLFGHRP